MFRHSFKIPPNTASVNAVTGIRMVNTSVTTIAVSHRPILPPVWATLPTDSHLYERPVTTLSVPNRIALGSGGRCICGTTVARNEDTILRPCKVYSLTGVHICEIELQACSVCPRSYQRYIGPDGREDGIFNLNNKLLFTHDLLDDYTASFTSSETPFTAWVIVTQRRYQRHQSPEPFVRDAVFLAAWFAYSNVLALDGDMSCPSCGPTPDDVIWDGVSLSFHRKHLLPSLRPPTVPHEKSMERQSIYVSQSLISSAEVRRNIRKLIDGDQCSVKSDATPSLAELTEQLELLQTTTRALIGINLDLGEYFNSHFGVEMMASKKKPNAEVVQLFRQVRGHSI